MNTFRIHRSKRTSNMIILVLCAIALTCTVTMAASVEPVEISDWQSGDAATECAQTECNSDFAYKIDDWGGEGEDGDYYHAGNKITISESNGKTFDWSSDYPVCAVIVKAGQGAYVYYYFGAYSDTDLVAPEDKDISHVTFCFKGPTDEKCASISGIKFHDRNADGQRDASVESGEALLSGWTIRLYKLDESDGWIWISDDETDENGAYSFTVYETGTYKVKEMLKDGWAQTTPTGPEYYQIEVDQLGISPNCVSYPDCDFGNIKLGSISGYKFKDCNFNGARDELEDPIQGWEITLTGTDIQGSVVGPITIKTNIEGYYKFDNLWPGTYALCEELLENWEVTRPKYNDNFNLDGCYGPITLPSESDLYDLAGFLFGNVPLGSITACKFYDFDEDGIYDGIDNGEGPVGGVQFDLYINGSYLKSGITNDGGCITFEDLYPGSYTLKERLDLLEGNWKATTPTEIDVILACKAGANVKKEFGNVLWQDETAWAANGGVTLEKRYTEKGNWATYVEYTDTLKSVTLFAGKTIEVGKVILSEPDNGEIVITIEIETPWQFADVEENVKIQDYATAPTGNPNPGGFEHKDTAIDSPFPITVPKNNFYGVHVDVERKVPYNEL